MTPWITVTELAECGCVSGDPTEQQLSDSVNLSTAILYALSGRRWPGLATHTVRPCSKTIADVYRQFDSTLPRAYDGITYGYPFFPVRSGGEWYNISSSSCACQNVSSCGCTVLPEITLGYWWVSAVSEVKIDGVVLDPANYRLDEDRKLVRTDGGTWPCCQDLSLADTEENTFSITFDAGRTPPAAGIAVARELACELLKFYNGQDCALPKRVTTVTREGVTMALLDPQTFIQEGRTGLPNVDMWLHSVNPEKLSRRGRVWSPDMRGRVRSV